MKLLLFLPVPLLLLISLFLIRRKRFRIFPEKVLRLWFKSQFGHLSGEEAVMILLHSAATGQIKIFCPRCLKHSGGNEVCIAVTRKAPRLLKALFECEGDYMAAEQLISRIKKLSGSSRE